MSLKQTESYDDMKAYLLKRFECSEEGVRNKFRTVYPESGENMTAFLTRVRHLFHRWVELSGIDSSFEKFEDLLLREQLFNSCSSNLVAFF